MIEQILAFDTGYTALNLAIYAILSGCFVCACTLAYTTYQFEHGADAAYYDLSQTRKPLTIPYAIPFLGNAFEMKDQHKLHTRLSRLRQSVRPMRLKTGLRDIYVSYGSDNVRHILGGYKQLGMKDRNVALFKLNKVPPQDLAVLSTDDSGDQAQPAYHIAPEKRIWRNTSVLFQGTLMAQSTTDTLAKKFQEEFIKQVEGQSTQNWQSLGLFHYLKYHMLVAGGKAFTGEDVFKHNPDWHKIIWSYDEIFLLLNLGLPKWMIPGMEEKVNGMRGSLVRWYEDACKKDDLSDPDDPDWEPIWGSGFWRKFVRTLLASGMSPEGAAASSMTTIWATHSNAIPGATWLLFAILSDPELRKEVEAEIKTTLKSTSPPIFDVQKLLALPLLSSIYRETLRIRVSTAIFRESRDEITLNNTIIPARRWILAPTWPAHTNPLYWGESSNLAPDQFDPRRFLELEKVKQNPKASKAEKDRVNTALSGTQLFPWGGGNHMCAGRNFAKQEIYIGAATMLMAFDIEVVGWEKLTKGWPEESPYPESAATDRPAEPDMAYASGGAMPPDRDLRVRMKRKNW